MNLFKGFKKCDCPACIKCPVCKKRVDRVEATLTYTLKHNETVLSTPRIFAYCKCGNVFNPSIEMKTKVLDIIKQFTIDVWSVKCIKKGN